MSRGGAVDEKATRRNNGNLRYDISRQGSARTAAPSPGPRALVGPPSVSGLRGPRTAATRDLQIEDNKAILAQAPGGFMAAMFPQTTRNWRSSDADAGAAYAAGDTGRALGASLRKAVTIPAGLAYDITKPIWSESAAERSLGEGLLGGFVSSDGTTKVNKAFTPPAEPTGAKVVASALSAGRVADDTPLTPQELAMAALEDRLRGPMTRGDLGRYMGMLPAAAKPESAKDRELTTTASIADSLYDSTLKQIAKAKDAGLLSEEEFQKENTKAGEKYFSQRATLNGANLLTMQQALMMAASQQPEEE